MSGAAGVEFIDENGGGPGVRLRKAAKAEVLRTGPDAFLRNEANFPGVGEAEPRAPKPVTHAAADHFRRNLQGHRSHADVGTGRVFDNR